MIQAQPLGDRFAQYQAGFNLLGRLTVLKAARKKTGKPLPFMAGSHIFADDAANDLADQAIYSSFALPPTGAVDYLRNLTPVTRSVFDGLTSQYKRDAITIAGVNDQRILQKVRDELAKVVMEGGTPADFKRAVDAITDEAGVARLASFEIDTVFNTNAQKAYSTGRYEQMKDDGVLEALPFWQYWTVGDDRVRPEHRALDGFIARAIDPVWMKIYPPSGYNCRCSVVPLMEDEALEIDKDASESGLLRLPLIAQLKVPAPGISLVVSA